jgi:Zn finger protein HypA/HybF involved in hydrogenase expression
MSSADEQRESAADFVPLHIYCLLCGYNISGAMVGGNCPECGEAIMRTFEWPHTDGVPHPVPCARCGKRLMDERIGGGCATCHFSVLQTLKGPRRVHDSSPVFAPWALMAGLLTLPCAFFMGFGALIPAAVAIVLLVPSYVEHRREAASRSAFIAAVFGAAIGVMWFLIFFYDLLTW